MNRLNWYIHASIEFHLNFDVSIFPDGALVFTLVFTFVFYMEKNV